ncbi:hypothetical protein [Streptococcus loxodontisalivarius]|uniref:Membrane protein YeaQ/YmgE (Transglycosylase-associated protein family) n=1 Tax=Streptococcus loxodontisalivarius TaxID=1349415 RepID=A0ABS2PTC8_9STRE|nr:hypothetical protein [Streptococcus loxodontisalivarius]MBM7642985.1 putative membrane protein YeaQ/YmgE (transglycosylase-associated protein family) [Streptococcus loxodontisalivarius]
MTSILAIIIGAIIAGLATALPSLFGKKVGISYWLVNIVLGALGAVAANQLLPGAYGPEIADLNLVPMLAGSLVLAGIGTWVVAKLTASK